MSRFKRTLSVLTLTLMLSAACTASVQANPVTNWLAGKITKYGYQQTGHVCANKPWYIPMPAVWWYSLTCAKVAR